MTAVVGLGLVLGPASDSRAELVTNGGFETGDFSGWTLVGNPSFTFVASGFSHTGAQAAFLGETGGLGSLSQTLATSAGTSYSLSFWFAGDGDNPSEFKASIGGNLLLDLVNPPFDVDYVHYSYGFTAVSSSTVLKFEFRDDPFFINLDDVSVNVASAPVTTPEPSALVSAGIGVLMLAGYTWRKRRTARPAAA